MIARRKYHPAGPGDVTDPVVLAQAHIAHVASLREARVHHLAITLELRSFYDSVAAEAVPSVFFDLLSDGTEAR